MQGQRVGLRCSRLTTTGLENLKFENSKGLNLWRQPSDVRSFWTESSLPHFPEDRKVQQEQGSVCATLTGLAEENGVVVDVWGEEEKAREW